MASDRHTRTEQIAHTICDRFHIPETDHLSQAIADASFTPLEAARMHTAAEMADRVFAALTAPPKPRRGL